MANYWQQLIGEVVEEFATKVDEALGRIYEEIIPSLLDRAPPAERRAAYTARSDYLEALRSIDPRLWKIVTEDALRLEERARQLEAERLQALEQERIRREQNLRLQMLPYGFYPGDLRVRHMGLYLPIPKYQAGG